MNILGPGCLRRRHWDLNGCLYFFLPSVFVKQELWISELVQGCRDS